MMVNVKGSIDFLFTADNDNHETGMANGTEGDLGIELNSGRRVNKASFVYNPKNTKIFLAAGSTIVVGREDAHQHATIFEAPVFEQYTCEENIKARLPLGGARFKDRPPLVR